MFCIYVVQSDTDLRFQNYTEHISQSKLEHKFRIPETEIYKIITYKRNHQTNWIKEKQHHNQYLGKYPNLFT